MKHEANLIKLAAALTAAPRWASALVIADGGAFTWGHSPAWSIVSAVLSVLFAGVEVYATSFIMRAWRAAKPGTRPERVLLILWIVTLCALVVVMAPPIFSNTTQAPFSALPTWLLISWSVCVAASTFLVIGGVGYSERQAISNSATLATPMATVTMPDLPQIARRQMPALPEAKMAHRGTYEEFAIAQMANPMKANAISANYGIPLKTAYNWIGKFKAQKVNA